MKIGCFLVIAISAVGTMAILGSRKPAPEQKVPVATADLRTVIADLLANDDAPTSKHLNSVVTVTGKVTAVRSQAVGQSGTVLSVGDVLGRHVVNATFTSNEREVSALKEGSTVKLKGRFTAAAVGTKTVVLSLEDSSLIP